LLHNYIPGTTQLMIQEYRTEVFLTVRVIMRCFYNMQWKSTCVTSIPLCVHPPVHSYVCFI